MILDKLNLSKYTHILIQLNHTGIDSNDVFVRITYNRHLSRNLEFDNSIHFLFN